MYTDFTAMNDVTDRAVRDLANVFEDIRVDKLGAKDYEGYLLWRFVLFKAHESTGTAPWLDPDKLAPPDLFAMMLLTTLEIEELGIAMFEEIAENLRRAAETLFGAKPMEKALKAVRSAYPLVSTEAAVELARRIMRMIRSEKNRALKDVEEAAGKGSTENFGFRQNEPHAGGNLGAVEGLGHARRGSEAHASRARRPQPERPLSVGACRQEPVEPGRGRRRGAAHDHCKRRVGSNRPVLCIERAALHRKARVQGASHRGV